MSLKLVPPRAGKSPNYTIRGTYLGVCVNRTAGTAERAKARKVLAQIKDAIERGRLTLPGELTFASAAIAYLQNGGEDRFLGSLNNHFGDTPISQITQVTIDEAAAKLLPNATAATRNRQIYTPVSAILKHVGIKIELKRPKGSAGTQRTDWLWPEQAFKLFEVARERDPEFEIFLTSLCYTGMRLSEAIWMRCEDVRLSEAFAYLPTSKNEDPRGVHLPPPVVAALANHPQGLAREGTIFRFRKNGYLYRLLDEVTRAAGLEWVTFHTFCHTYATWMRRYGGLDAKGLVSTGRWRSEKSVSRYMHTIVTEESRRADQLPVPKRSEG